MIYDYEDLKDEIRDGFIEIVDEFVGKLTADEQRKLCACGWNYITFADKWEQFYGTDAYKKMIANIRKNNNIPKLYGIVKKEKEVADWMQEHYSIDINDKEKLKWFYPKGYMRGVVWDAVYWIGEYDEYYGIHGPLYDKIDELKEDFWDNEYNRVAEEIGLAEANRELKKRQEFDEALNELEKIAKGY